MKQPDDKKFQTHIAEPRWQQIVSIAIVIILALGELLFLLKVF